MANKKKIEARNKTLQSKKTERTIQMIGIAVVVLIVAALSYMYLSNREPSPVATAGDGSEAGVDDMDRDRHGGLAGQDDIRALHGAPVVGEVCELDAFSQTVGHRRNDVVVQGLSEDAQAGASGIQQDIGDGLTERGDGVAERDADTRFVGIGAARTEGTVHGDGEDVARSAPPPGNQDSQGSRSEDAP